MCHISLFPKCATFLSSLYVPHFSFPNMCHILLFPICATFLFSLYVPHISFPYMCHIYLFPICATFLFSLYVLHFSFPYMCHISLFPICAIFLFSLYVPHFPHISFSSIWSPEYLVEVQIIKLLIMQFSPVSCSLPTVRPIYLPQNPTVQYKH